MSGIYNFTIDKGATWSSTFTWEIDGEPVDLTGFDAEMVFPGLTLDNNGNGITLGGVAGTIQAVITDEESDLLTFGTAKYHLDVISGGGERTRLLRGRVELIVS